jgi:DNA-binding PadR family transcriptional regulator
MLDFAILGLLMERPRHGYELRRALGELGFWKVSFGSLYPAIRRLEKRDSIEATKVSGRRKAYKITHEGRKIFDSLLHTDPETTETARGFQVRLAFLGHLPSDRRIQVMDRRRRELSTQLKTAREILIEARSAEKNEDRYRIALMEHAMQSTEADIAWLDGLIAAERGIASAI